MSDQQPHFPGLAPQVQPPPPPPPPDKPRVPILQRPWLPWTISLILAVGATVFTATAIVDRDEASRELDQTRQQIDEAEGEIERQEGLIEDSKKARSEVLAARVSCLRASDLFVEFLRGVEEVLEELQARDFRGIFIALDQADDVREDLLPEFRRCQRESDKVT